MIFFWKERAWFHSSNHITLVNYLDSMGSLWRYICSQELVRMRGIKSMQVYSWKRMECTSGLARFIEFNFSDQHAICLNSRKREFEGSVAQTFICRGRRGERWFQRWFGWTRGSTILPWISSFLFFSMWCHLNLCNMLGEILNDWLLSLRVLPHTYSCTCFIQENKNGNKQGLYRFSNTGSLNLIESKTNYCLEH